MKTITLLKVTTEHFRRRDPSGVLLGILLLLASYGVYGQQERTVLGTVTDENGEGLPGVTILIKGTTIGTVSTVDGSYTLTVPSQESVLAYSYLGYVPQEVTVGSKTTIDITMQEDLKQLDQVVVVGYGTQRKAELTVSVAKVEAAELSDFQVSSIDQALAGRVAGLDLVNSSGSPGAPPAIQIRGANSVNASTAPLFVIDGFPVSSDDDNSGSNPLAISATNPISSSEAVNPLAAINPNDIESIEVLKDAAATSIYGARGANGVILITTKSGKEGKSDISIRSTFGVSEFANRWDMMNSEQYSVQMFRLYENSPGLSTDEAFRPANEWLFPINIYDTDWIEEIEEVATTTDVGVTLTSGNANRKFSASLGYFNQQGTIRNSKFERFTGRLNSQNSFLDNRLTVAINANISYIDSRTINSNRVYGDALSLAPIYPTYFEGGDFAGTPFFNAELPLLEVYGVDFGVPGADATPNAVNPIYTLDFIETPVTSSRVLSNAYLEYEIIEGLKIKTLFGADFNNRKSKTYLPVVGRYQNTPGAGFGASISQGQGTDLNWLNENTLTYDKSFGDHSVSILLGQSGQRYFRETLGYTIDEPDDQVGQLYGQGDNPFFIPGGSVSIGQNTKRQNDLIQSDFSEWTFASYFGRINYSYKGKVLFTGTVRRDGASQFAAGNKWGVFPGLSVAWNIHREAFLTSNIINELKFRASWGQVGNHRIGNLQSLQTSSPAPNPLLIGRYANNYIQPGQLVDPLLSWETTSQTNIGVDVALWNDRITTTIDVYQKNTFDLLFQEPVPATSGFTQVQLTNIGELMVRGIEFSIGADVIRSNSPDKPNLNVNLVLDHYAIEVVELPSDRAFVGDRIRSFPGEQGARFYGLIVDGIFQTDEEADNSIQSQYNAQAGDFIYRDVAGFDDSGNLVMQPDGQITDADRVDLGSAIPAVRFGLNTALNYRRFDLSLFFKGALGAQVYNQARRNLVEFNGQRNGITDVQNAWTPENRNSNLQAPRANRGEPEVARSNNDNVISAFLEDADFLRLQALSVGYRLPSFGLGDNESSARVFVTAQNLFVLTGYSGLDPETGIGDTFVNSGIDQNIYPRSRTFTVGFNLNF